MWSWPIGVATPPPPPPAEPAPAIVVPLAPVVCCGLIGVSGIRLSWPGFPVPPMTLVDDDTVPAAPAVPTSVSLGDVAGVRMPRLSYLLLEAEAFGELAELPLLLLLLDDEDEEDEEEEEDDEDRLEEDAI